MDTTNKEVRSQKSEVRFFYSIFRIQSSGFHAVGFTLVELLVTIAIISLLTGLLVPTVSRSLNKNRVADDAEVFKSKLEQARLLAGSTQTQDEAEDLGSTQDQVGYYGIFIPATDSGRSVYLVQVSYPSEDQRLPCPASKIINSDRGVCLVEEIEFSQGVILSSNQAQLIVYRVPTGQLFRINQVAGQWLAQSPQFTNPVFELTYQDKVARVEVNDFSGKVEIGFR